MRTNLIALGGVEWPLEVKHISSSSDGYRSIDVGNYLKLEILPGHEPRKKELDKARRLFEKAKQTSGENPTATVFINERGQVIAREDNLLVAHSMGLPIHIYVRDRFTGYEALEMKENASRSVESYIATYAPFNPSYSYATRAFSTYGDKFRRNTVLTALHGGEAYESCSTACQLFRRGKLHIEMMDFKAGTQVLDNVDEAENLLLPHMYDISTQSGEVTSFHIHQFKNKSNWDKALIFAFKYYNAIEVPLLDHIKELPTDLKIYDKQDIVDIVKELDDKLSTVVSHNLYEHYQSYMDLKSKDLRVKFWEDLGVNARSLRMEHVEMKTLKASSAIREGKTIRKSPKNTLNRPAAHEGSIINGNDIPRKSRQDDEEDEYTYTAAGKKLKREVQNLPINKMGISLDGKLVART